MLNQEKKPTTIRSFFSGLFRIINHFRLLLINILFFSVLVLLIINLIPEKYDQPGRNSVLLFNPTGRVVNRFNQPPFQQTINKLEGNPPEEVLMLDLVRTIDEAAADRNITAMMLDLTGLFVSGAAMLDPVYESLKHFKEKEKKIYAFSSFMTQEWLPLYLLADQWMVDPYFYLEGLGYGTSRLYYGKAMDQWGIDAYIFKAGEYKSFTEVYSDSGLSIQSRNEMERWIGILWSNYSERIEGQLSMANGEFNQWISHISEELKQQGGDWAQLFLNKQWIDGIQTYDQFVRYIEDNHSVNSVDYSQYAGYITEKRNYPFSSFQTALLPLSGNIVYGEGDFGSIGSASVIRSLEVIQNTPEIQALVLWIDSPGGSAMASEEIRRKLVQLKDSGITIICLMGNTAASGGYWIAAESDYIVANPSTITGSIGVFSYLISAEDYLNNKIGVIEDGYYTSDWKQGGSIFQKPSETNQAIHQSEVDFIYKNFLDLVSKGRKIPNPDIKMIAEGRVWTGVEAVQNGLVDQLGFFDEVNIEIAKRLNIKVDNIHYQLFQEDYAMGGQTLSVPIMKMAHALNMEENLLSRLNPERLIMDESFNDPRGMSAYLYFD